jgi:hypothetical protein
VGIEPSPACTDQHQTAAICVIEDPAYAPDSPPKRTFDGGVDDSTDDSAKRRRLPPDALVGVVETALARALTLAAEAGRWEIVAQLAEELAARGRGRRNSAPSEPSNVAGDPGSLTIDSQRGRVAIQRLPRARS